MAQQSRFLRTVQIIIIFLSCQGLVRVCGFRISTKSHPNSRRNLIENLLLAPFATSVPLLSGAQISVAKVLDEQRAIKQLPNGIQYSDARIGNGPPTQKKDTVVMHLRALRRDGAVLFDTLEDGEGTPLLHPLGSVQDFDFFGGDSTQRSKVTMGIEDAILGGTDGKDPLKAGGIRLVVVPAPLAYGHAGVSRYDAMKMGLRKPVPRNEMLRYEVEILRCQDVQTLEQGGGPQAQICCRQPDFPCKSRKELEPQTQTTVP